MGVTKAPLLAKWAQGQVQGWVECEQVEWAESRHHVPCFTSQPVSPASLQWVAGSRASTRRVED